MSPHHIILDQLNAVKEQLTGNEYDKIVEAIGQLTVRKPLWKLSFRSEDIIPESRVKLIDGEYKDVISPMVLVVNSNSIYQSDPNTADPRVHISKWSVLDSTTINPKFASEVRAHIARFGYFTLTKVTRKTAGTRTTETVREVMIMKCEEVMD